MLKIVIVLLLSFNLHAQDSIKPVLANLSSSIQNVRDFTVLNDEAYFSAQNTHGNLSVIIRVLKVNNQWVSPEIASFSGRDHDIEPFISPDGLRLYFASNRMKNNNGSNDYDIWYVKRKTLNTKWSSAINMGPIINSAKNEFFPSITSNNSLYFTANLADSKGKDDIYVSEFKEGKYQKPYSLSHAINSSGDEYNAYIAPNEMYIIFGAYKRKDSIGSGDLYISYKDTKGNWSSAVNLGKKVNSPQMDYCPFVEIKSNTLYFTSKRTDDKQTDFSAIDELLKTYNSYKNGMSRIYKTKL